MFRHQRLIGSHNALSCFQTSLHKGICRLNASHHLNYYFNLRIIDNHIHIMDDLLLDRIPRKIAEIKHIFHIDLICRSLIDDVSVRVDHLNYSGSHRAVSHYCYVNHCLLPFCTFLPGQPIPDPQVSPFPRSDRR